MQINGAVLRRGMWMVALLEISSLSGCGGPSQSAATGSGGDAAAVNCNLTITGGPLSVNEPCTGSWRYDSTYLTLEYDPPPHMLVMSFYPIDLKTLPLTLSPNHPSSHTQEGHITYYSPNNDTWSLPADLSNPKDGFTLTIDKYTASLTHGMLDALLEPSNPSEPPAQLMMTF